MRCSVLCHLFQDCKTLPCVGCMERGWPCGKKTKKNPKNSYAALQTHKTWAPVMGWLKSHTWSTCTQAAPKPAYPNMLLSVTSSYISRGHVSSPAPPSRTVMLCLWFDILCWEMISPPGHGSISEAGIWTSFSEVPRGAVLWDRNRPQIWQRWLFLTGNTEEHLPIKAHKEFGLWWNAIKWMKNSQIWLRTKDPGMPQNQTRHKKEQIAVTTYFDSREIRKDMGGHSRQGFK